MYNRSVGTCHFNPIEKRQRYLQLENLKMLEIHFQVVVSNFLRPFPWQKWSPICHGYLYPSLKQEKSWLCRFSCMRNSFLPHTLFSVSLAPFQFLFCCITVINSIAQIRVKRHQGQRYHQAESQFTEDFVRCVCFPCILRVNRFICLKQDQHICSLLNRWI